MDMEAYQISENHKGHIAREDRKLLYYQLSYVALLAGHIVYIVRSVI